MEIVKVDGFTCNDNVALTVCNWYFGQYSDIFWNVFQFRFYPSQKVGNGFTKTNFSVLKNVSQMYGLDFTVITRNYTKDTYCYMIKMLQEKKLLILEMDVFYCPWSIDYQKRHNTHSIILTAYQENAFLCVDPAFKKVDIKLLSRFVQLGFLCLIEPVYQSVSRMNLANKRIVKRWDNRILKCIRRDFHVKDILLLMNVFVDFEPQKEFGNETNIWYIPLYVKLSQIYSAHVCFGQFLQRYCERTRKSGVRKILDQLNLIGGQWHAICLWIMKMHQEYMKGECETVNYKKLIHDTLGEIACLEKKVISDLNLVICKKINIENSKRRVLYHHVELPFNARSHLSGLVLEDYDPLDKFQVGRRMKTSNCDFQIQKEDKYGNNVLVSNRQVININQWATDVYFLGCAVWGNQTGEFEVYVKDRKMQRRRVFVSDWNDKKYLEEEVVWHTVFQAKSKQIEDCNAKVVQFRFSMGNKCFIEKICMPDGEKIHIFAMSLREN